MERFQFPVGALVDIPDKSVRFISESGEIGYSITVKISDPDPVGRQAPLQNE